MGTLTANQARLPEYCDHKLPTSCRLSSIPGCCACADERAHSASYSVYIDGVGFVPRGTRWQRYCWFCKEFWENRVASSGLRPAQTKVPTVPDQTEFLERWYEFYRGYRTVKREDGSEERVAVLGEDFKEVSPGCLPRTLEEMRAGRERNASAIRTHQQQNEVQTPIESGHTLDETLDELFQAASAEERDTLAGNLEEQPNPTRPTSNEQIVQHQGNQSIQQYLLERRQERINVHGQAMAPAGSRNREYRIRRVAALRRELHRLRNGIERVISGLMDLGEDMQDYIGATGSLAELGQTLDLISGTPSEEAERATNGAGTATNNFNVSSTDFAMASLQTRVNEARQHFNEAHRTREQATSELHLAEQEFRSSQQRLQRLQHEQRTTENYIRLFGTREEMAAQGEDYESPIGAMFTRAYERFSAAEAIRREERTLRQVLEDEARSGRMPGTSLLSQLESRERDVWNVPVPLRQSVGQIENVTQPSGDEIALEDYYSLLRMQDRNQQAPAAVDTTANSEGRTELPNPQQASHDGAQGGRLQHALRAAIETRQEQERIRSSAMTPDPPLGSQRESTATLGPDSSELEAMNDNAQLLGYIAGSQSHRTQHSISLEEINALQTRNMARSLSAEDRERIDQLFLSLDLPSSMRLMPARFARRRQRGMRVGFVVESDSPRQSMASPHNIEIMAEAFQMSADVRRRTPALSAPERLTMLYRLQAGERYPGDLSILSDMVGDEETYQLASRVHEGEFNSAESERRIELDQQRREAARQGHHSRFELDAQRRATQDFAVAAGRLAMQTGPATLLERMANRDDETRAAYQRLQENGYTNEQLVSATDNLVRQTVLRPLSLDDFASGSDSEPDDDQDEEQGLDARDSGRPEPKSDADMTVTLECRICYTQTAEIACLPCGHLVMCKWCSEQHSPTMQHDHTRPQRAAGCPVCRKGIRQKVRVFRA